MAEFQVHGSGGHVTADLTEEQAKKADLGVGKLFLAPIGKLEPEKMFKHYCNICETEFASPPKIRLEESANEQVAENLVLIERGQYTCEKCSGVIGEYRVFQKKDGSGDDDAGHATKPSE